MRKTSISIFVLVIMFLMCSCSMPAAEAAPWQNDDSIQLSIEKIIALVYENKDIGENNDFNEMMDTGISIYLADKIAVEQYVTNLNGTGKENYDVQVRLREKKTEAAELYFTFQVITTYKYMTAKDFDTEISEEVIVTYDREKELITDFYSPFNYFDISIRGENVKALKDIPEEKYRKALERLMNDIGMEYKSEEVPLSNNEQSNLSASKTSTLNYSKIVSYARNNYYKAQPASGNGIVPYYDFSEIPGNWDCTNFVSHALIAGGAGIYDTGGSGISSTGWYYRNLSNRSSSWSGVTNLYQYLINNTHTNSASGIAYTYSHNGAFWGKGDVMQFKFSGSSNYGHSTIITKKTYSSDGARAYAYVTGRTSDTQYNNNQAADNIAPGGSKRTIMVYNY